MGSPSVDIGCGFQPAACPDPFIQDFFITNPVINGGLVDIGVCCDFIHARPAKSVQGKMPGGCFWYFFDLLDSWQNLTN